jgi:hypothetical protein
MAEEMEDAGADADAQNPIRSFRPCSHAPHRESRKPSVQADRSAARFRGPRRSLLSFHESWP